MHDERRGEPVELEGYVTAVTTAGGGVARLYLHAAGRTFRLALPLGPERPLRVRGRLTVGELVPVVHVEHLAATPDRGPGARVEGKSLRDGEPDPAPAPGRRPARPPANPNPGGGPP